MPYALLFGVGEHRVGRLNDLEARRRRGVAGGGIGVEGFGQPAIRRLNRGKVGVAVKLERRQRVEFGAAAAAVAGAPPAPSDGHG